MSDLLQILQGDALAKLRTLPDESVHCCVTSPPYWGLRDYGTAKWESGDPECKHRVGGQVQDNKAKGAIVAGVRPGVDASQCLDCGAKRIDSQIGLEPTPAEYVAKMVEVFGEVRRVLRDDGTLWLNLGDSYAGSGKGTGDTKTTNKANGASHGVRMGSVHGESGHTSGVAPPKGLKAKDLIGIPWRVAFGLQADGWYLRSDIIWHKPNPMPESVTDRPTKAHEYLFLLSKSAKYFYDAAAIAEPLAYGSIDRLTQDVENQEGSHRVPGKTNGTMKAVYKQPYRNESTKDYGSSGAQDASATKSRIVDRILSGELVTRNKRSVWTVPTHSFKDAHFATYPPELITPCILAGCPVGGTVLDPFAGSGTTGQVALELGRKAVLIELNPAYIELIRQRTNVTPGFSNLHSQPPDGTPAEPVPPKTNQ